MMPICVIAGLVIVGEAVASPADGRDRLHSLREPEVEHLHRAVGAHLDIRRLEVAVDDPLLVGRFERLRNLPRDRQRLVERDRPARDALRQIVALDQFHHEGRDAPALFEAVDAGDVGMVQRREHFRFALETREPIVVSGERWRQDLDRDLAFQPGVGRPIDLAHAPFADLGGDFVDAEAGAGSEGQVTSV